MRPIKIFIFLVLLNCLTLSFSNSEVIEKIKIELMLAKIYQVLKRMK